MSALKSILDALDEKNIAMNIGSAHDQARMRYHLPSNVVESEDEFCNILADYFNHHFSACNANGGRLSRSEAYQRAKEIIDRYYQRRKNGNFINAYNDAHEGMNGGMRVILDIIADDLKMRSIERYIQNVFDRFVAFNSWEKKVSIMRQFLNHCGHLLGSSIDRSKPEKYAKDFTHVIRSYVEAIRQTSTALRRN